MKKFIIPILLLVMFIPFYVNAETCDTDKISISSITVDSKSDSVEELDEAIANGKNINLNLSMSEVGDNIEYKIVVKNDSNEDYELDKNSFNANSNYIEYTLKTNDDSLIVKAGKTKEVFLKVQYKNEVPDASFDDGKFNDNKSFVLNLSNGQTIEVSDTIKNPKTGDSLIMLMLICILCVGITMYVILSKKKINKFMVLLLTIMITLPASVYALCKIEIAIESNVIIEKSVEPKYEVGYLNIAYGFYTDEELSKYQITSDTECFVIYVGETKYNNCSYVIIKDDSTYKAGETVTLKTQNIRSFYGFDSCPKTADGSWHCPASTERYDYTLGYWYYDSYWNYCGFTFATDDKDIMNFDDIDYDKWNNSGYFRVTAPTTFKMPAHSTIFANYDARGRLDEPVMPPGGCT